MTLWPVRWPDGTEWDVSGRPRLLRKDGRFFIIGNGTYRELQTKDPAIAYAELKADLRPWLTVDRRHP